MASATPGQSTPSSHREPTEFQRKILNLSLEEFLKRTNIHDLVRAEALEKQPHATLSDADLEGYAKYYYEKKHKVHKWHTCALKNLLLLPEPELRSIVETPVEMESVDKKKETKATKAKTKASKMAADTKKRTERVKSTASRASRRNKKGEVSYSLETLINEAITDSTDIEENNEPSDFQKDVLVMDLKRFTDDTNIRTIVHNELRKKDKTVSDEVVNALIGKYFDRRVHIETWWTCGLKNLKYRWWEPKKATRNVKVQKVIRTFDKDTQYDPLDFGGIPRLPIAGNVAFTEIRMSQLTERIDTQGTVTDPLEASLRQSAIPVVNGSIGTQRNESGESSFLNTSGDDTVIDATTVPESPAPQVELPVEKPSIPNVVPQQIEIIELDDDDDDDEPVAANTPAIASHNEGYEVLLETTTQTQTFNENCQAIAVASPDASASNEHTTALVGDAVDIKDEPIEMLSISQVNAKYAGDLVAQDLLNSTVPINDTPNTEEQDYFVEVMETAGSGRVINDSGSTICDASQRPDVTAAIDTLDDASEPTQSSTPIVIPEPVVSGKPKIRQKPCPKSKKIVFVETPVAVVLPVPAADIPVAIQDIDNALAEMFAETQPPQNQVVAVSTEDVENINPQLTGTAAAATNNIDKQTKTSTDRVEKLLRRTVQMKRVQKKSTRDTNDTLSNIQPPKYNYNALLLVPKKRSTQIACDTNDEALTEEEEPIIEFDDTPPCIENPREFLIEDASIDGGSQLSQMSSVANILNTGNSLFLSSQLLNDGQQTTETQEFCTAPEASHEIEIIDDVVIRPPDLEFPDRPLYESPPPGSEPVERPYARMLPPPKRRRLTYDRDSVSFATAVTVTPTNREVIANSVGVDVAVVVKPTVHQVSVSVAEPAPAPISTGFECIPKEPKSINFTYLHYIDIESVSYRYDVDRLPSDDAYNICHQQEGLRTLINFKCDGLHRIEIKGESIQKLLKLKYTEWRAVQAVLELVKKFTYNSRAKEPHGSSLLERSLHHLFASASKFSNVHIQHIHFDEEQNRDVCRVLDTTYSLQPKARGKRLRSTIDPYVLKEMHFGEKRFKKN